MLHTESGMEYVSSLEHMALFNVTSYILYIYYGNDKTQ